MFIICTSALIVQSHDDRGVILLRVKGNKTLKSNIEILGRSGSAGDASHQLERQFRLYKINVDSALAPDGGLINGVGAMPPEKHLCR